MHIQTIKLGETCIVWQIFSPLMSSYNEDNISNVATSLIYPVHIKKTPQLEAKDNTTPSFLGDQCQEQCVQVSDSPNQSGNTV